MSIILEFSSPNVFRIVWSNMNGRDRWTSARGLQIISSTFPEVSIKESKLFVWGNSYEQYFTYLYSEGEVRRKIMDAIEEFNRSDGMDLIFDRIESSFLIRESPKGSGLLSEALLMGKEKYLEYILT